MQLSVGVALLGLIGLALGEHSTSSGGAIAEKDDAAGKKREAQPEYAHERDDLDKFQELHESSKHLRDPDSFLNRLISASDLEKRALMRGFQGMRGKKNEQMQVQLPHDPAMLYDPSIFYNLAPAPAYDYYYDKRAPMGFQGVRGKKSYDDEYEKRAPMGFQGVRGKKDVEEVRRGRLFKVIEDLEKRAMMGFQGMRGKKSEEYEEQQQQLQQQQEPQLESVAAEWQKRAPMGFQGVRGRKSSFLEELDDFEKRALLGFHGMRGKKDVPYERVQNEDAEGYVQEKRPMMMGFQGMRGKRSTNYYELQQ